MKNNTDIPDDDKKRLNSSNLTWDENDPLAEVFKNLTKVSICKSKFSLEDYRSWLQGLMEKNNLTIKDLTNCSDDWQLYHNDKTKQPVSPRGSFNTWINNFVNRRLNGSYQNRTVKQEMPELRDDDWYQKKSDEFKKYFYGKNDERK